MSNSMEKKHKTKHRSIDPLLAAKPSSVDPSLYEIMEKLSSIREELKSTREKLDLKNKALVKANNFLKQGEFLFKQIFDQAPLGAALVSLDFRFKRVNNKFCHITGYTEEELALMGFPDITHPDDLEADILLVRKLLAGDINSIDKQKRYIRKDNRIIWSHTSVQMIRNVAGNPSFFLPMIMDISEQKYSEKKLVESEERLRLAFENANEGVCLLDTIGKHIEVNNRMCEIFGYTKDELEAVTANDITHPEDQHISQEYIKQSLIGEMERAVFEKRYIHKSGDLIWARVSNSLVRDADGIPLYFISHIQDITQKKLYEAKLGNNIERLRKAMGGIIQAMSLTVEARDPYTSGHQRRVADLARAIAQEMGLAEDRVDGIRMSGAIHDIGKISVPSEILSKPVKLSHLEYSLIKNHPSVGYDILKDIDFPWPIAEITLQHHERINGSGYPNGISGQGILLEAKILAVADVVEAIASHRPYRPAFDIGVALSEISKNKGVLYEPEVVVACLRVFEEKKYLLN
jgi:PAS domain S-box-containing protein